MLLKNLLRRKIRTMLTVLGISLGVAAIIGLGSMANTLQAGYTSMLTGSKADLVLSQPDSFDISYSSVDEAIGAEVAVMPEVAAISGMLQGIVQVDDQPYFFVFAYPSDSFVLDRFTLVDGYRLDAPEARHERGRLAMIGSAAAEVLDKGVGNSLYISGSVYRIVGIYQTGQAFEDSGAVLDLEDAQGLLGKPRTVSLFYIQLKQDASQARFEERVARRWPDLALSGSDELADKQDMIGMIRSVVWVIGGLAVLMGGVSMTNAQLMAVFERTREIGVLRAVGWSARRVLALILGETLLVCLLGGVVGVGLGWLSLAALEGVVVFGVGASRLSVGLLLQAGLVVFVLGLVGGIYPAWRASRLQPIEALRYEGGSGGSAHRLPLGGLAVQGLWQRRTRTLLTLLMIGLTVGSIMALEALIRGFSGTFDTFSSGGEIMLRQANVSDTSLSSIDERVGDKLAALPEVLAANGMIFTAVTLPESGGFFLLLGHEPSSPALERYRIVAGKPLTNNRQIILGKRMSEILKTGVGDTLDLGGYRFQVAGIYESRISWEEAGGVVTLRSAQALAGRAHKVTMYSVKLRDPLQADALVQRINAEFPDVHAALSSEFVQEMPDMQTSRGMLDGISALSILVGGLGVLNTMLMSVFERTREIGVLRALGWRRRAVLGLVLREATLLGLLGGVTGVLVAFGMVQLMFIAPLIADFIIVNWDMDIFLRALGVALALGVLGGLYPAYRATRLQPTEALRYE